jgi:hypothetical protein
LKVESATVPARKGVGDAVYQVRDELPQLQGTSALEPFAVSTKQSEAT